MKYLRDRSRTSDVLNIDGDIPSFKQGVSAVAHEVVPLTVEGGIMGISYCATSSPTRCGRTNPSAIFTGTIKKIYINKIFFVCICECGCACACACIYARDGLTLI